MKKQLLAILALGVLFAISGCSAASPAPSATLTKDSFTKDSLSGSITVFAAASLTKTFGVLVAKFEAAHPGVTIATSFAGSADLAAQLTAGAPADVFASADAKNMAKVATLVGTPVKFATNVLEIAVPSGNPAKIVSFADLAKPGVKTVICAPAVPCGAAIIAIETAAGVKLTPVSEENAVTDVLGKVSSREADAGLVYVTDVRGAGASIEGIAFPEANQAVNTYPIATVTAGTNRKVAQAFVDFVTGAVGRSVLASAGFGAP
ncbi:molybdate ABC transporter substrate-binding protein [Frigoribacterium sp. CG_9.8]|uniref:molybdate ABC transporter substrate-binding protein n=1 Tax=Frigoribacterium sp. CG_9.8 TaxID=2787733 RepID=UPI0018CBF07E|nr:molybdate ABC transporter substrate-binding protein [Frigoribacterium sp. CG_9.8]MBG6106854.1 molybdate transport system substrate-binding protein [Frigoribacterium sp. CG_9.8]